MRRAQSDGIRDCKKHGLRGRTTAGCIGMTDSKLTYKHRWQQAINHHTEVFRVTEDGEVYDGDTNITDDDAAMADCLRRLVDVRHGVTIRPANREQ